MSHVYEQPVVDIYPAHDFVLPDPRIMESADRYDISGLPTDIPLIEKICYGASCSWGLDKKGRPGTEALFEIARKGDLGSLSSELTKSIHAFQAQLGDLIPQKIYRELLEDPLAITSPLQLFASGSAAVIGAKDLLVSKDTKSAATWENGSELLSGIDDKLRLRHRNNSYIHSDSLFQNWKDSIEVKGSRFLSFTLASKSGTRYDALGKQIAEYVTIHNNNHPQDKITLIIDAVQMFGRDTHKNTFDWLKTDGVAGVVHSGSKAPGGIAHAGFLWLTEDGVKQMQAKNITDDNHREILDKRGWVNYIASNRDILAKEGNIVERAFSTVRSIDNLHAITAMYETLHDARYLPIMKRLRAKYQKVFTNSLLGFSPLDDGDDRQLPSLLSFTHPLFTDKNRIAFDNTLFANGAAPGGYLHDPDTLPIVRWGLNWEVVQGLIDGTLTYHQLEQGLDYLDTILHAGLGSLRQIEVTQSRIRPLSQEKIKEMNSSLINLTESVSHPQNTEELGSMSQNAVLQLNNQLAKEHGSDNVVFVTLVSGERSDTASHLKVLPESVHKEAVFIDLVNYYSDEDRRVAQFVGNYLDIPLSVFRSSRHKSQYEQDNMYWWKKPTDGESMGEFNQEEFDAICNRIKTFPNRKAIDYIHQKYKGKQIVWVRGDMQSSKGRESTPMLQQGVDGDLIFYPKAFHWTKQLSQEYSDNREVKLLLNPLHFDPTKAGIGQECVMKEILVGIPQSHVSMT